MNYSRSLSLSYVLHHVIMGVTMLFGVVIDLNLETNPPLPFDLNLEPATAANRGHDTEPATAANMPGMKRRRLVAPDSCLLPPRYRDLAVEEMNAEEGTLKLILCKRLHKTDVSPKQDRLTMPYKQIKNGSFLNSGEEDFIDASSPQGNKKNKIRVTVLDPSGKKRAMNLAKWNFKANQVKSWWFALNSDWNNLVKENSLCEQDSIQVWSFRNNNGDLCFIIHKTDMDSSASSFEIIASLFL